MSERSVSYKTREGRWITLYASEHDAGVFASEVARIEAERTRAEEAEALLGMAVQYAGLHRDDLTLLRRIEAHLQEHTE